MKPGVPDGYVLIPERAFAAFVALVVLACVLEIVWFLIEHERGRR